MVKKVIGSLVILGLIVGGVGVWQVMGEKPQVTKSVEQGAKNTEQKGQLKSQASSLKPQSHPIKTVKIMNTKSEKMIEEVREMATSEYSSPIYVTWSSDESKILYVMSPDLVIGVIVERNLKTKEFNSLTYPYDDGEIGESPYGAAFEPDVSPDGKQIVFVMKDDKGIPQVWKMNVNGKNKIQLTNFEEDKYWLTPKWSPDGKKILVHLADIYLINVEDNKKIKIKSERGGFKGDWSPDGGKITLISGKGGKYNLWIINSDGTNPVQLTTDSNVDLDYTPSWSPNGKKIAYTDEGKSAARNCDNYIMIINTDGSNPTKIILPNNMGGNCPAWSKDGKRLLCLGIKDVTEEGDKGHHEAAGIYIITLPESILKE